jgi:cell wall-associated NlpC family hydrolase
VVRRWRRRRGHRAARAAVPGQRDPRAERGEYWPGGRPVGGGARGYPAVYLALYLDAAQTCRGLPWGVLAGIGTVESDNGRSDAPGVHAGANFAGAEGPMQFEPTTFSEYAVDADPGAPLSVYVPADAVYTAAAMLCASGAASGIRAGISQAVFAYNHLWAYVARVLAWAARYTVPAPGAAVATAISFALAQLGKPYQWGAAGPGAYDCSGLVYAAYAAAGIHIARTTFQWYLDGPQIPLGQVEPGGPAVLRWLGWHAGRSRSRRDVPGRRPVSSRPRRPARTSRSTRSTSPGSWWPPVPPTCPPAEPAHREDLMRACTSRYGCSPTNTTSPTPTPSCPAPTPTRSSPLTTLLSRQARKPPQP